MGAAGIAFYAAKIIRELESVPAIKKQPLQGAIHMSVANGGLGTTLFAEDRRIAALGAFVLGATGRLLRSA